MHSSLKVASLPQNPLFLNQVELFLLESNNLIRDSQYRKCILLLDSQYKKLLPIESPLLLRIKVLRRLNYCTVMYFKLKINKNDVNARKNQYLLWSRLLFYIRDFHDIISLLKLKFQKKFYSQELIKIIIKALKFRSFFYSKNTLVARGLLHFHYLTQTVITQVLVEKIPIFFTLLGKFNLIAGSSYFQLQNYEIAEQYYTKALEFYQKNIEIIYKEILMTTQEQIRLTMSHYTREIILTLFLLALVHEQMSNYIRYQESIKMMCWFDSHYQSENSIYKLYLHQYVDENKYMNQAVEKMEIIKVLRQAVPEEESLKPSGEEDQLNYFNNMLYEFDEFQTIRRQYYYYDNSQQPFQIEPTESETQIDKLYQSRTLKTNTSAQMLLKSMQIESESTNVKSMQLKTKISENGLSTRFQTESEGYSQPSIQQSRQQQSNNKTQNKEDITLQEYYGKTIEKSVKLSEIETLTFEHNNDLIQEIEEAVKFDKGVHLSKQQIQFKRLFGSIGTNNIVFEHSTRESKRRQIKKSQKHISQQDIILTAQIKMKTKTEQSSLLDQYHLQKRIQSTPSIFSKIHSHRSIKNQEMLFAKPIERSPLPSQQNKSTYDKKPQEEEQLIKEIKINTKETIKTFMDEKELLINLKPKQSRKSSQNTLSKYQFLIPRNNALLEQLIVKNHSLATTTDQLSNSKKITSLKSLLEVSSRNPQNGKRMTTVLQPNTPRTYPKMNSHTLLPIS